jgi:PleD family two-component response regulator
MPADPLDSAAPFLFQEKPARILIINADVQEADELCALLEGAGYEVAVATYGQYAILQAPDFTADLVILDTELQNTTSSDVVQVLQAAPRVSAHYRRVPILYLAHQEFLVSRRFHQHPHVPVSDYLFRPLDVVVVLDRVQRALAEGRTSGS